MKEQTIEERREEMKKMIEKANENLSLTTIAKILGYGYIALHRRRTGELEYTTQDYERMTKLMETKIKDL